MNLLTATFRRRRILATLLFYAMRQRDNQIVLDRSGQTILMRAV